MGKLAIIGGSGLGDLAALENVTELRPPTPYGQISAPLKCGTIGDTEVVFLARHGVGHTIPPHRINYRANVIALAEHGVTDVIAVTAVGGIVASTPPGRIVIPDQIIDYTYGREHTFSDGIGSPVNHIDFTHPFTDALRRRILRAAEFTDREVETDGVYGATQGPRLESAAEIKRMARDGCTIVGMTGMPEAALAREAGLAYANCSLVVNWAAGTTDAAISLDEIHRQLETGMRDVVGLLIAAVRGESG